MSSDSEGSPGRALVGEWNGRAVETWVPAPLRERRLDLSVPTARVAERACGALQLADARMPRNWEPLSRLLLRNEGVASSGIEGLREPIESVLLAGRTGSGGTAGWVADNLVVIDWALDTAHEPLTVDALNCWHRRLMQHGTLSPELIGVFRPVLGWVGGSSPLDAAYVPPPPREIPSLVDDLVWFANESHEHLDPVSRAAIIHAQFEAVHPYGDGNGRLGRVLVNRTLLGSGLTSRALVPISMAIARDPGGYLSGLRLYEQGQLDAWVRWFAEIVEKAAANTNQIVEQTTDLVTRWEQQTADLRVDHSAHFLIPHLPAHPILSAKDVAELLKVSERSARNLLADLVDRNVLSHLDVPTPSPGRNRHWFAAPELLNLWRG